MTGNQSASPRKAQRPRGGYTAGGAGERLGQRPPLPPSRKWGRSTGGQGHAPAWGGQAADGALRACSRLGSGRPCASSPAGICRSAMLGAHGAAQSFWGQPPLHTPRKGVWHGDPTWPQAASSFPNRGPWAPPFPEWPITLGLTDTPRTTSVCMRGCVRVYLSVRARGIVCVLCEMGCVCKCVCMCEHTRGGHQGSPTFRSPTSLL